MPAYDNYTSTGQLHPYTAVIREPFLVPPTRSCLAARLNSTRLDLTRFDSTVTDESLSVLSPDWHTRDAYCRTEADTAPLRVVNFLSRVIDELIKHLCLHVCKLICKRLYRDCRFRSEMCISLTYPPFNKKLITILNFSCLDLKIRND